MKMGTIIFWLCDVNSIFVDFSEFSDAECTERSQSPEQESHSSTSKVIVSLKVLII